MKLTRKETLMLAICASLIVITAWCLAHAQGQTIPIPAGATSITFGFPATQPTPPVTQPSPPIIVVPPVNPTPPIVVVPPVTQPSGPGIQITVTNSASAILYPGVGVQADVDDNLLAGGLTLTQLQYACAHQGIYWNWGDTGGEWNVTHGWSSGHDYKTAGTYYLVVTAPDFAALAIQKITIVPDTRPVKTGLPATLASNTIYDLGGQTINYSGAAADLSNLANVCIRNGALYCTNANAFTAINSNASTISPTIQNVTFDGVAGNGAYIWQAQGAGGSSFIGDTVKMMGGGWLNQLDYSGCFIQDCASPAVNGLNQYLVWNSGRNLTVINPGCGGSQNQWQIRSEYNGTATNVRNVAVIGGTMALNAPHTAKGNVRFMSGQFYTAYGLATNAPTAGATEAVEPGAQSDTDFGMSYLCIDSCNLAGNFIRIRPAGAKAQHIAIVNTKISLNPTLNVPGSGYYYPNVAVWLDTTSGAIDDVTLANVTVSAPNQSSVSLLQAAGPGVTNLVVNGKVMASPFVGTIPQ